LNNLRYGTIRVGILLNRVPHFLAFEGLGELVGPLWLFLHSYGTQDNVWSALFICAEHEEEEFQNVTSLCLVRVEQQIMLQHSLT